MADHDHMQDHECDDSCSCSDDEDLGTVTLTMDDDTEVECAILSIYPVNDKQYIALLPVDENGDAIEDADVYIYRYVDNGENEDPDLENIDDDEEYEAASDAFDEILDEEDLEEDEDEDSEDGDEDSDRN